MFECFMSEAELGKGTGRRALRLYCCGGLQCSACAIKACRIQKDPVND